MATEDLKEEICMVRLMSSDGKIVEVEEEAAMVSPVVAAEMEAQEWQDHGLPVVTKGVTAKILEKVVEYSRFYVECMNTDRQRRPSNEVMASRMDWRDRFLTVANFQTLIEMFWAAKEMKIAGLQMIVSDKVIELIEDMSTEEFKTNFVHSWVLRNMDTLAKEANARFTMIRIYSAGIN